MRKHSFSSFVEGRLSGNSVRQSAMQKVVPIGGFVPGQNRTQSIFKEAKKVNPNLIRTPKMPILFDEHDIKFILQFPPGKWPSALQWRYGEGLKYAALERKKSGTAPETGTITLAPKGRGKPMVFQNVNLHMGPLLQKLSTPIHEGGNYEFDLDHWKEISMESKSSKGEKRLVTPNYLGLLKSTAAGAIGDWKKSIPTGLLGTPDSDSIMGVVKAVGAPPTGVGFLYDGTIANYSATGGIVKPLYSPKQISGLIDAKVGTGHDGSALVNYTYQMGDETFSSQEQVSTLMPGRMFSQGLLNNFTTSRQMLQELARIALEENPELMSEPSLRPEQIAESLPKGKVLEFGKKRIEVPYDSFMYLYGESKEELQTAIDSEISPEEYRAEERASGTGPKISSEGKYKPSQMTKGVEPVTKHDLERIGYSRPQYAAVINKYFVAISPQNINVMGLDGEEKPSLILKALDYGIANAKKHYFPLHAQRLEENKSIMYMNVRSLIKKQSGKGPFVNFAEALKSGDPEAIEQAYSAAKNLVTSRTSTYVAEVAQLDLGYGTRRKPRRTKELDAPMKSGQSRWGTTTAAERERGTEDEDRKIVSGIDEDEGKITFAYQSNEMWAKAGKIQKDKKKDIEGGGISQIAKESHLRSELETFFMSQYVIEKDLEASEYDMAAIKRYAQKMSNKVLAAKGLTLIQGTPDATDSPEEKDWLSKVAQNKKTIDAVRLAKHKPMFAPDFGGEETEQQAQSRQVAQQTAQAQQQAAPDIVAPDEDFGLPPADAFRNPEDVKDYINAPSFTQGVSSQQFIDKLRTNPQEMQKAKQLNTVLQSKALAAAIARAGEAAGAA
jgi:hypothetical protein